MIIMCLMAPNATLLLSTIAAATTVGFTCIIIAITNVLSSFGKLCYQGRDHAWHHNGAGKEQSPVK